MTEAKKLTTAEREIIEKALVDLAGENGVEEMGAFSNVASWIATTRLHDTR